jgi:hypothetical protein
VYILSFSLQEIKTFLKQNHKKWNQLFYKNRSKIASNILSFWELSPSVHEKMHGHASIGQTSLFGCSSAGHSGINQLGGVYVNGELLILVKIKK